jgi:hypothetical protein
MQEVKCMAEPLPPEGYIRLKDAFDTFEFGMLGETPESARQFGPEQTASHKKADAAHHQFVSNLDSLAYRGKVVSANGSLYEITGDLFDRATYADLLPLHNAIPLGIGGPLGNYVGGIVCLDGSVFFEWLEKELSIHLHGEIQNGELTPVEANERLAKIKLPALESMPPRENYHDVVLKETYWTLPMTVTWIAWRNIDDVVKQYWPYAKHGGYWRDSRGPNQSLMGMVWESAREPSLSDLMFYEAAETYHDNPPLKFIKESREELWQVLQSGDAIAIGVEGTRSHREIAAYRWASLKLFPVLGGPEFVGAGGAFGNDEKIFDVKLPSKEVLRIWPAVIAGKLKSGTLQQSNVSNTPISEKTLKTWLDEYKLQNRSLTRDAIEIAGKGKFGERVTITRLRALYAKIAPNGGNKRGRKSAKTNSATSELSEIPE